MDNKLAELLSSLSDSDIREDYSGRNMYSKTTTKKGKIMAEEVIKNRLAYLRREIEAERISYEEIAELQSLVAHIDKGDMLLLEWAGVKEAYQ